MTVSLYENTMSDTTHSVPTAHVYTPGDKVFHLGEQRLATVLDVYGNGVFGSHGDMRLDLSGNTAVTDFEPYDPVKHAAFDHTFVPIKREWAERYGITQSIPLRDAEQPLLSAYAVVLDEWGGLLWVTHPRDEDGWGLPGGKVEPGESGAEAVARMVHQKTGMRLPANEFVPLVAASVGPPNGRRGAPFWVTTYIYIRRVARDFALIPPQDLVAEWVLPARLTNDKCLFLDYTRKVADAMSAYIATQPLEAAPEVRLSEEDARERIEAWLAREAPGYPDYMMVEDGDYSWAFWVAEQDTTSYLHSNGRIEWSGTGWPHNYQYDGDTGMWSSVED